MESGTDGGSGKGVFISVSESSEDFMKHVLAPLQHAYLYEESKQSFRYTSAVLIRNPALEEKYNAFRAKRRETGYSEEDLEETFGFLLFDDVNKANALGETGVLTGNSTCTTLGDNLKGVYISMYADCLDPNRWYHGKSGYIAIIRLTKGRIKKVLENYTQKFTEPTGGFDCHVSEQLPSVSDKTSSFLAFERTQYYMYELLDDGSSETAPSPSLACPFAIVSFSYTDTKATLVEPEKKSEEKKLVSHYVPWRGELHIGHQVYNIGLKSTARTMIPAKLPSVVKVDRAISMSDLRQFLPRAVFDTCFSGQVFFGNLYCVLCELVSSGAEETLSISVLLQEMKEKDLALTIPLNDGGFLILLHSSHFLTYDDAGSSVAEVLQGLFVFPDSRVIRRDTKFGEKKPFMSPEILRVLPVLTYAEGEVEKTPVDTSEDLCDVLTQHMQSYASLINPGLALSPSRETCIYPDQYDVPDAHKHLYSSPEWTTRAWQSVRSYLSKPNSFELPVSKASEILAAGQEERREDFDDDVYLYLSSPEEAPASPGSMASEDQSAVQESPANFETSVDNCIVGAEAPVNSTAVSQNVAPNDLQDGAATNDIDLNLSDLIKTDDVVAKTLLTPPTSDDLSTELIVSITSAERTVTNESLSVISTVSATTHNEFQICAFSTDKLQTAAANSLSDEIVKNKRVSDCPEVTLPAKTRRWKRRRGHYTARKKTSKACVESHSLQTVKTAAENDDSKSQKDDKALESSGQSQVKNTSDVDWRKRPRHKRTFRKLSSISQKLRSATVGLAATTENKPDSEKQIWESTILMEVDVYPLRKKTERWDLKPVISECGRILVPHGSVDVADQVNSLKDKFQAKKDEQTREEMLKVDVLANATVEVGKENTETAVDKTETCKDEGIPQNVVVSIGNSEHSILRQLDDGSGSLASNLESSEHSLEKDSIDTPPSKAVQEIPTDSVSPGKLATKGELLLSKLKTVLLRGKRKTDLISDGMTPETPKEPELSLKKSKGDSDTEILRSTDGITVLQNTNASVEVSEMLSVDPVFAYALGLTPKVTTDEVKKIDGQETQVGKTASTDKQLQIIQRPPSIFPRRRRIKTLKKHQGIPTEYIKKKWWLHFQTPACYASEKLENKECNRANSVRKTVEEKVHTACSSSDALNLLADLALGASNDQVLPQPDAERERKPKPSVKKCGLAKELTSAEQESILHALLKKSVVIPTQPLQSPSPSHLLAGSELVGLVSKEHAYSLPPSSSLLLGLPGTPFQVSPLCGSTRLLQHHQTMYGNGIQTLHPSVGQEDRSKDNYTTPESLDNYMVCRTKFRKSRTFVNKDGCLQVTRQWKEDYNFNLDSKFSTDPKNRAIIRALHGPWDFSAQDMKTHEELRLIIHMWIGLFYSRSTARFFHIDSNFPYPCPEGGDSLEISSEAISAPVQSELNANSSAPLLGLTDTSEYSIGNALDLSKKDTSSNNLGQRSEILDLSLRNFNVGIVTSDLQVKSRTNISVIMEQKDASESLTFPKSPAELHECHRKTVIATETIDMVNDVRSVSENNRTCPPRENIGCLEHTDVPFVKDDETLIPEREQKEKESIQPVDRGTASGIGHMLPGSNEKMEIKNSIKTSEATEMGLVNEQQTDLSKSMPDKQEEPKKGTGDLAPAVENNETESKDGENKEVKENQHQEGNIEPSQKVMHTADDSSNNKSSGVCSGNVLEENRQLAMEEPKTVPPGKAGNVNRDGDCCVGHEDETHFEKGNGLYEKESSVSAKEDGSDLRNQSLLMYDSPDSTSKDCNTSECNIHKPLDEQPPLADSMKTICNDLELRTLCENSSASTDAISDKALSPPGMDPVHNEPAAEADSGNGNCLIDEAQANKPTLSTSKESTCSLEWSHADGSIPQPEVNVETGSQNKVMTNFDVGSGSSDHEDVDKKSIEGEKEAEATQKEPIHQPSPLPQDEVKEKCDTAVELTEDSIWIRDKINEGFEKTHSGVVIPFIGEDASGEDSVLPPVSPPRDRIEETIRGQNEIPFIGESTFPEAVLPREVYSPSQMYRKQMEQSVCKMSDVSDTIQPLVLGSESEDRCPTPTMDEQPYKYTSSSNSSTPFIGSETFKNITQLYLNRHSTPIKKEMPLELNSHKFTDKNCQNPPRGLNSDLELRTLRVLQSLDKAPKPTSKYITTRHTAAQVTDKKLSQTKPAVVATSTSQKLSTESSDNSLIAPFKSRLEEVLGVKLHLNKTDLTVHQRHVEKEGEIQKTSVGQDYCHTYRSLPSTEYLQANKPDQDQHKTSSQTQVTHEHRSYSQRPVMAVKPSKTDESQTDCVDIEEQIENSSINKLTKNPIVAYTTSMLLERNAQHFERYPEKLTDIKQEAVEPPSRGNWLSNVNDSKSYLDKTRFAHQDLSYRCQEPCISQLPNICSSSTSVASSSKLVGVENQHSRTYSSVEKVRKGSKKKNEMGQKHLGALASLVDYQDDSSSEDSLDLEPQSSLVVTVYNSSQKTASRLEQLSKRCQQDDLTQASMERECLIFSEQMKQLLKRSNGGPICQRDTHDKLMFPCVTPVTVHFSNLEEEGDSIDHLNAPSLVGQKIMVDMSNKRVLVDPKNEVYSEKISQTTGNPLDNAWVSGLTAECTAAYEVMMNNLCAGTKVLSRQANSFQMDIISPKSEPSNHFDFCGPMKRKLDESFRSNLNSVVKKSCRTKYRFYILVTSDDPFFEETREHLEAAGHAAVQPSQFFLGDEASSLLIVLRNEDIAEHICEIPHLLQLKKSPVVQFAGIDEPDDVVNLTHQELFTRGGFIMMDKAVLEPLSLCDMKKISEVMQELCRSEKWKWMLHYRDSRRLKENARLSAEAKEKKLFLNRCQEAGLVEVLPYHECDLMSRDRPDYLSCLVRLQVQNVSARYPVFITDATDATFGRNGVLTVPVDSFLTNSPSEIFVT